MGIDFLLMGVWFRFACLGGGGGGAAVGRGVFGAGSSFLVGRRAAGGAWLLFLGSFLLLFARFSLSRGGWSLGYHSMVFRHFPNIS